MRSLTVVAGFSAPGAVALPAPTNVQAIGLEVRGHGRNRRAFVDVRWDYDGDADGFYVAISDSYDAQSTHGFTLVPGGDARQATIAVPAGCWLVSVFAWQFDGPDSPFGTAAAPTDAGKKCP